MKNQLKKKLKYVKIWKRGDKMLTYSKDDFDESLEDIIKSANEIINKNQEKEEEELEKNKEK